jgi:hypothetical protein
MKTKTEKAPIGLNVKSLPKNENEAKSQTIDTLNGLPTEENDFHPVALIFSNAQVYGIKTQE